MHQTDKESLDAQSRRVLVVEDNPDCRGTLCRLLELSVSRQDNILPRAVNVRPAFPCKEGDAKAKGVGTAS
jgi:hypothetical protein